MQLVELFLVVVGAGVAALVVVGAGVAALVVVGGGGGGVVGVGVGAAVVGSGAVTTTCGLGLLWWWAFLRTWGLGFAAGAVVVAVVAGEVTAVLV
jgi:hypothetical protein